MDKFKMISAVLFQFILVGILTACLFYSVGDPQTIQGALIGLCVGIGLNQVKE